MERREKQEVCRLMIWLGSLFLASLYYGLTLCVWYGFSDLWLVITITVIAGFMLFGGIFAAQIGRAHV